MPPTPNQPQSSNKPLIIVGAIIAAVLVLGAGIFGVVSLIGGGASGNPEDVVVTYLEALAEGDAETALAQGARPATDTFVTDEILQKQQEMAKISDIKVIDSSTMGGSFAKVHVTYMFGDKHADVTYRLKDSDGWKMEDTTVEMTVDSLYGIPSPTVFGTPISNLAKIYVFPGPVVWGSENKNIKVVSNEFSTGTTLGNGASGFADLDATLSESGLEAATAAVRTYFDNCAAKTNGTPEGCPQYVFGAVDGTVKWTAPADLSSLEFRLLGLSGDKPTVSVNGETTWSATFEGREGPMTGSDSFNIFGDVDLSTDPPTYTE